MGFFDSNPTFTQDSTLIEDKDFEPVPVGSYLCEVQCADEKTDPNKPGLIKLEIEFAILSGPHADKRIKQWLNIQNPAKPENQRIALEQLKKLSVACGNIPYNKQVGFRGFVGARCMVKTKIREWDGKKYAEVHWVDPVNKDAGIPPVSNTTVPPVVDDGNEPPF